MHIIILPSGEWVGTMVQLVPEIELTVEALRSNEVFDPLEFLGTDVNVG